MPLLAPRRMSDGIHRASALGIISELIHSGGMVRMQQTVAKFAYASNTVLPSLVPRHPKNHREDGGIFSAQSAACCKKVNRDVGSPSSRPDHFLKLSARTSFQLKENPLITRAKEGAGPFWWVGAALDRTLHLGHARRERLARLRSWAPPSNDDHFPVFHAVIVS